MSQRLDIEAIASQSEFGNLDDLASYIAQNTDVPMDKLSRVTGLTESQVGFLLTSKVFRERLTELITYTQLTPDRERAILGRMLAKALDEQADFKDFREAATWVYRQGGMLRADKTQVDNGGTIRVAFALDASAESRPVLEAAYVPPDPLAGVVGLPQGAAEVEAAGEDVEYYPVDSMGVPQDPQG